VSGTEHLETAFAEVAAFSARNGVSVLTGAITSTREYNRRSYWNSILLFKPDGSISKAAKNILVPFAEYVPLSRSLPWLSGLAAPAGGVEGYIPGKAPSVFESSGGRIGVLVCFESAFPGYAGRLESLGSRLLVVLTQDGWWRGTAAATQHFSMARFRASETGRYVVQVGVTGISGLIDASGRAVSTLPSDVPGTAVFNVPMLDGSTTYGRIGRWMVPAALGIWIALLGLYGLRLRQYFTP
jgi:apolipoprotein N-acyltransferase